MRYRVMLLTGSRLVIGGGRALAATTFRRGVPVILTSEREVARLRQTGRFEIVELVEPKAVEPKAVEPKAVEPKAAEPKTAEPKVAEPKVAEPKAVEPKTAEPKAAEPKAAEPKVAEPKTAEPKAAWSEGQVNLARQKVYPQMGLRKLRKIAEMLDLGSDESLSATDLANAIERQQTRILAEAQRK